jgi:hypothetical protein
MSMYRSSESKPIHALNFAATVNDNKYDGVHVVPGSNPAEDDGF